MNTQSSSPDFMAAPKKGKGVRRLNRLPLLIVIGLVLLAVIAISYTILQKQKGVQPSVARAPETVNFSRPLLPIQPDPDPEPPPLLAREAVQQQLLRPDPVSAQRSAALENRLRLIARVEENRMMAQEAALGAGPAVQEFVQASGENQQKDSGFDFADTLRSQIAGLSQVTAALGGDKMGGSSSGLGDNDGIAGDPNRQDEKRAFLANAPPEATYLSHTRLPALSQTEVKAGTVIPGVMIGGINSDLPGMIIGQVRQNVYDTATGMHLLVPAGARLVGTYDSSISMGQRRVLVAWNRIIFPDGSSVSLDRMPGADVSGYAGFKDKVNNHYWRIFGNAFMLSLFSAGIQLSQPDPQPGFYHDTQQTLAAEIGRQLGLVGMEMARRNLDIQPTLEIRPGYQFNIMVTKDMILPPWQGHPFAVGQR